MTDLETFGIFMMDDIDEFEAVSEFIEDKAEQTPTPAVEKPLGTNERRALMNIIGAMLEMLKNPRPGREDDAAIIRELVANYDDKHGISESNLNRKFPEAKRSLRGS